MTANRGRAGFAWFSGAEKPDRAMIDVASRAREAKRISIGDFLPRSWIDGADPQRAPYQDSRGGDWLKLCNVAERRLLTDRRTASLAVLYNWRAGHAQDDEQAEPPA